MENSNKWLRREVMEVENHNIFTKLLIFLGLRCECGGKLKQVYGWPYMECVKCGKKYY